MAGSTNPTVAPWPVDPNADVIIEMGGLVLAGHGTGSPAAFDNLLVPFNCYVRKAVLTMYAIGGSGFPDGVELSTLDDTKTIVADLGAIAADVAAVAQTLHADVLNDAYEIEQGDHILLKMDTDSAEDTFVKFRLYLHPIYAGG